MPNQPPDPALNTLDVVSVSVMTRHRFDGVDHLVVRHIVSGAGKTGVSTVEQQDAAAIGVTP